MVPCMLYLVFIDMHDNLLFKGGINIIFVVYFVHYIFSSDFKRKVPNM